MGRITNTPTELMTAFSTPGNSVTLQEFQDFWKSLTPDEKTFYRENDFHPPARSNTHDT